MSRLPVAVRRWLGSTEMLNWRNRFAGGFERPGNWRCWVPGRHRWAHEPDPGGDSGWWQCQRPGCHARIATFPGANPRLPEPRTWRERRLGFTHLEVVSARARAPRS